MHKKSSLVESCLAVRTRLELATPCVTGMYSNQTELPDRLFVRTFSRFEVAKIHTFFVLTKFFCAFKNNFFTTNYVSMC